MYENKINILYMKGRKKEDNTQKKIEAVEGPKPPTAATQSINIIQQQHSEKKRKVSRQKRL